MKFSYIDDDCVGEDKRMLSRYVSGTVECETLLQFAEVALERHIAPAIFHEGRRHSQAVTSMEWLCFDFDDGMRSSNAVALDCQSRGWRFVILGSKNHLKNKNDGKGVIERFHLFLPLDQPLVDNENYKVVCRHIASVMEWTYDQAAKDVSRYFFRHSHILHLGDNGTNVSADFVDVILRTEKTRQANLRRRLERKIAKANLDYPTKSVPSVEKFQRTKGWRMLVNEMRYDGGRYAISSTIIGIMKKCDLEEEEALDLFDKYSSYGHSFTRESISRRWRQWH